MRIHRGWVSAPRRVHEDPSQSIEELIASASRAEERFQRLERHAERAVTALRESLGERGRYAAAGLLDDVAETHAELSSIRAAATEARLRLQRIHPEAA